MIGMTFRAAKGGFIDRAKVKRSVDAGTRRVFSKFGAFVRQRARTSIRNRKGTSPPGRPPHSHVGLLRRFIFFAYDPSRHSVVIGPTKIRDDSEAPRLLEHGGEAVRREGGKAASRNDFQDFWYNIFRILRPSVAEVSSWRTSRFIHASALTAGRVWTTATGNCTTRLTS